MFNKRRALSSVHRACGWGAVYRRSVAHRRVRPAFVLAVDDEAQLVAAFRPHLGGPYAFAFICRDAERVVVAHRLNFHRASTLTSERVCFGGRAVEVQPQHFALGRLHVLGRSGIAQIAGGDVQRAVVMQHAQREVAVARAGVLLPDDLEIFQLRGGGVEVAVADDPLRVFIVRAYPGQVDVSVLRKVRHGGEVMQAGPSLVEDLRHTDYVA